MVSISTAWTSAAGQLRGRAVRLGRGAALVRDQTRRPILCGPFCSYKLVQRIAERMWATGRMTMANGIPSRFPFSLAFVDLGGSEKEPPIGAIRRRSTTWSTRARFMHHKPLLLLYKPRLEEKFDRDLTPYLVNYMNRCLPYAAEPSLFKIFSNSDPSFYYSFFERPDWYNRYRPLFLAYVPLVKRLALAGWEPVTFARTAEPQLLFERSAAAATCTWSPTTRLIRASRWRATCRSSSTGSRGPKAAGRGWPNCCPAAESRPRGPRKVLPCVFSLPAGAGGAGDQAGRVGAGRFRPGRCGPARRDRCLATEGAARTTSGDRFQGRPGRRRRARGIRPLHRGQHEFQSDRRVLHSGPRSSVMVLRGKSRTTLSVSVPAAADRTYRISAWAKTELSKGGSTHFYIRWLDSAGTDMPGLLSSTEASGAGAWQELALRATAPKDAARMMLVLVATKSSPDEAKVWFDDPSIVELGPAGRNKSCSPGSPSCRLPRPRGSRSSCTSSRSRS